MFCGCGVPNRNEISNPLIHESSDGLTMAVVVLHDLTLAASYADQIALMYQGRTTASGLPRHVLTDAPLSDVFDREVHVSLPPQSDVPYVLSQLWKLNRKKSTA